jgi:hypothetical protein
LNQLPPLLGGTNLWVLCEVTHLAAEMAGILGVLCDLHLLDRLTEGGTIPGTVLPDNSNLLGPLGLK